MSQSRRQRTLLVRIVLLFFTLNFFSLTIYFFHSRFCLTGKTQTQSQTLPLPLSTLKPWPSLPSFLPWNSNPNLSHGSCEAYFGNGFSQQVSRFGEGGNGGWFRCFYSATLKSSVCEGGRVRMDPRKIKMSKGGESLESVMGRREEEELPRFEDGAFEIEGSEGKVIGDRCVVDDEFLDHYVPWNAIQFHAMRGLMKSMRIVGSRQLQCSQWIEEPTVLVTRFEYANLFHTVTDWYNAYVSSRVTSLPNRPHLIYMDGHCKAPMEETWEALFTSATYAKNFSGSVCFRHAIFSPLGYENAIFKGLSESFNCHGTDASNLRENPDKHKTSRLSEFGEMLRAAFDLPMDDILISTASIHNILFVRREDYLAHPRHNGKVDSRLSNEQELFDSLRSWAANQTKCMFNVVNGRFAHMTMKEQINYMHKASIVIGAHGAGLSHLISARSKAIVLEITSTQYHRPHFPLISKLKGLEYHAIKLPGSYANPEAFIDELSNIVRRGLGC